MKYSRAFLIPAVAAAWLLLAASRIDTPRWFYADRVGSAGEWFSGIIGALVLVWALWEPARTRAAITERDARRRDAEAAEQSIRAIYESRIRHQEDLPDDLGRACRRLYDELEIQREIVTDPAASRRMRAFMVFLAYTWDDTKRSREGVDETLLHDEVRLVSDACKAQLFHVWKHEPTRPWAWPDGERTGDGDPVEQWIRDNCASTQ
ncbi:MAG: hypothetical protein R8G01_22360 [Ilumatobacteraceae bacterium]|nr:hypothetical protein [Ilumatobacteraceae bacterium]